MEEAKTMPHTRKEALRELAVKAGIELIEEVGDGAYLAKQEGVPGALIVFEGPELPSFEEAERVLIAASRNIEDPGMIRFLAMDSPGLALHDYVGAPETLTTADPAMETVEGECYDRALKAFEETLVPMFYPGAEIAACARAVDHTIFLLQGSGPLIVIFRVTKGAFPPLLPCNEDVVDLCITSEGVAAVRQQLASSTHEEPEV